MLNRKKIKNLIVEDQVKEDKELVLNSLKEKLDLQLTDERQNKFNRLLKPVVAFACAVVVCVAGYFGYLIADKSAHKNQFYKWKDVSSLNLNAEEYCLAYKFEIREEDLKHFEDIDKSMVIKNYFNGYFIYKNEKEYLVLQDFDKNIYEYEVELSISYEDILKKYEEKYNKSFTNKELNNKYNGLLFEFKEDYLEFYTIKNKEKLSIFVEY